MAGGGPKQGTSPIFKLFAGNRYANQSGKNENEKNKHRNKSKSLFQLNFSMVFLSLIFFSLISFIRFQSRMTFVQIFEAGASSYHSRIRFIIRTRLAMGMTRVRGQRGLRRSGVCNYRRGCGAGGTKMCIQSDAQAPIYAGNI